MYLNDDVLADVFNFLPRLLEDYCTLYFDDPVGLKKRLTLVQHPSEVLQSTYSAIYRTKYEYMEFLHL